MRSQCNVLVTVTCSSVHSSMFTFVFLLCKFKAFTNRMCYSFKFWSRPFALKSFEGVLSIVLMRYLPEIFFNPLFRQLSLNQIQTCSRFISPASLPTKSCCFPQPMSVFISPLGHFYHSFISICPISGKGKLRFAKPLIRKRNKKNMRA